MQTLVVGYEEAVFSPDINYIYRKQLEEAEILVINKIDVVSEERLAELRSALESEYPEATIFEVATREGVGVEPWFDRLVEKTSDPKRLMEVDYERYGVGEALLGWYNAKVTLCPAEGETPNGNAWLANLMGRLHDGLKREGIEIAHLKTVLTTSRGELASMQLTRTAEEPRFTRELESEIGSEGAVLTINLRAEADPDLLERCVLAALRGDARIALDFGKAEAFRPGQPTPTHRVTSLAP